MRTNDRDPVSSVKAYLHLQQQGGQRSLSKDVALHLRNISDRLARARRTEQRIELSNDLKTLFQIVELPPA
jgi:hypothetical protein